MKLILNIHLLEIKTGLFYQNLTFKCSFPFFTNQIRPFIRVIFFITELYSTFVSASY